MSDEEQAETTAVAMVSFALAVSAIFLLRKKGLLQTGEMTELIDGAMLYLEQTGLVGDARKHAHSLLEKVLQTLNQPPSPLSP
jgi:hypothetical protein